VSLNEGKALEHGWIKHSRLQSLKEISCSSQSTKSSGDLLLERVQVAESGGGRGRCGGTGMWKSGQE
jgi:hypothetical protein